jgi:phosphoribosylformylglycinamidine cyclo-ligase
LSNNLYTKRGVSSDKEDVHRAIKNLDKGLYPKAFCKIYPDYLGGQEDWVNIMHADGAGTKSVIAYLYWKETGDIGVWRGIAQDAIVMNIDDLLCVGVVNDFIFSSTIGRNKHLIPGEVIAEIINGSQESFDEMSKLGIAVHFMGGETADVGDVVRTIIVDGTITCRLPKNKVITNEKISVGDVIVGFASYGKATYEKEYNSGIGSNGLTSARHDMLAKTYEARFHESWDPALPEDVRYNGLFELSDTPEESPVNVGKLLLSPTRTYAPVVKAILENHFDAVHGMIHCSGGGQTKVLHYIPDNLRIVKDNLLEIPPIFKLIQQASKADWQEMYKVFNMGHRLEIFTTEEHAQSLIAIANQFNISAQIIGHVENAEKKELVIKSAVGKFTY